MDEARLQIKLSVDTSELTSSIAQTRRTIESVSTNTVTSSVDATSESTNRLRAAIEGLQGLQFADILMDNFDAISENVMNVAASVRAAMGDISTEVGGLGGAFDQVREGFRSFNPEYLREVGEEVPGLSGMFSRFAGQVGEAGASVATATGGAISSITAAVSAGVAGITAALGPVGLILLAIAAVVAALTLVIRTIKALVNNALEAAKRIKELTTEASKIGLSVPAYEEWSYVLHQVGVEADLLADAIKTLTEMQNEVRAGSEDATAAFKELGLSVSEVSSMSQEQLFEETIKRLQNVENASYRTSLAYRIFGEDAAQLSNVLYLTNEEMGSLINNYYALGAAPSHNLVHMSAILESNVSNLRYAWEGLKNTLAEAVMPVVNAVVRGLTAATMVINAFMKALFGVEFIKNGAKSAAGSMDNIKDKAQGAKGEVDKLKRAVMGFDELNVMPGNDSGSSQFEDLLSKYGGDGFTADFPVIEVPDVSKITDWIEKYKDAIRILIPVGLTVAGILLAVFGFASANPIMGFAGLALAGMGIGIGMSNGAWDDLIGLVKTKCKEIKNWVTTEILPMFTKDYWTKKWDEIKKAAAEKLDEIGTAVFKDKWKGIKEWFATEVAPKFTKQYWKDLFNNIKLGASEKLEETKADWAQKWEDVKKWYATEIAPKFTKQYWKDKFNNIKLGASEKLGEVKTTLSNAWNNVKNWFSINVAPKFTKQYWKDKFSGMKDGLKENLNGLIGNVETFINNIAKKLGGKTVSKALAAIGIDFDLTNIKIPRLATGGIVTSSTLANIGEAGREAVLPLENNTGWMDTLADRIAARQSAPSKIVLALDGKELGYATINSINNITRQTGTLQLAII